MVKKFINTTINVAPYLEKNMSFACGSRGGGWGELQLLSCGEGVGGGLSEVRETAVAPGGVGVAHNSRRTEGLVTSEVYACARFAYFY